MKKFAFIIITILVSCQNSYIDNNAGSVINENKEIITSLKINRDELMILDQHYPHTLRNILTQNNLSTNDILILHQIGISKEIIIHLIKYTNSNYLLTTDDVVNLQLKGVPKQVINIMIES